MTLSPSSAQRLGDTVDVILYYKYFDHELSEEEQLAVVGAQEELCSRLGLRGRVRVATEGINGTLGGDAAAVDAYIAAMETDHGTLFNNVDWKRSCASSLPFPETDGQVVKAVDELSLIHI